VPKGRHGGYKSPDGKQYWYPSDHHARAAVEHHDNLSTGPDGPAHAEIANASRTPHVKTGSEEWDENTPDDEHARKVEKYHDDTHNHLKAAAAELPAKTAAFKAAREKHRQAVMAANKALQEALEELHAHHTLVSHLADEVEANVGSGENTPWGEEIDPTADLLDDHAEPNEDHHLVAAADGFADTTANLMDALHSTLKEHGMTAGQWAMTPPPDDEDDEPAEKSMTLVDLTRHNTLRKGQIGWAPSGLLVTQRGARFTKIGRPLAERFAKSAGVRVVEKDGAFYVPRTAPVQAGAVRYTSAEETSRGPDIHLAAPRLHKAATEPAVRVVPDDAPGAPVRVTSGTLIDPRSRFAR
jgi:hypothetical protein